MVTAGYSGTPLLKKLGIKPETSLLLINEPGNYPDLLQADISKQRCAKNGIPDIVHLFAKNKAAFEIEMKKLYPLCKKNPAVIIWVSWYKKSAKIPADITEDVIRDYGVKNGLVDVKVCAVSDILSGLKLVVPLSKR